jgi:hypothetical protein
MPALLSHHLFGRAILARQNHRVYTTRDARDAFLLGNQGPDPLFYATRSLALVNIKTLGSRLHNEHISTYLKVWRELLANAEGYPHEILQAYLNGYLCHYALDRTAHPLIYAFEEAILYAGAAGINLDDGSFIHGQIEADLDVFLLYQLTGRTIDEYYIPKQVLYSSTRALFCIGQLYREAARLLGSKVPQEVFSLSVEDMRTAVRLLYSPGGTKRGLVGHLERLVRPHSLLQAMSHRREAAFDNWYANEEHVAWLHPQTRERRTESFVDLFDAALETAFEDMELFSAGAPVVEITKGLDFSGNRPGGEA